MDLNINWALEEIERHEIIGAKIILPPMRVKQVKLVYAWLRLKGDDAIGNIDIAPIFDTLKTRRGSDIQDLKFKITVVSGAQKILSGKTTIEKMPRRKREYVTRVLNAL